MKNTFLPRLIFWETTKRCNLSCLHCRAVPVTPQSPVGYSAGGSLQLETKEVKAFIEELSTWAKPIFILSGGEPLLRQDIFELASFAANKGLSLALATNGTLITPEITKEIKKSGIKRVSISLDGASENTHDNFRRVKGAFNKSIQGINNIIKEGIPLQINTTVTKQNINELDNILKLTLKLKAVAWHIFLLVPVGCGLEIAPKEQITPQQYEDVLVWFYEKSKEAPLQMKATCAPHYLRIVYQKAKACLPAGREEAVKPKLESQGMSATTKGCLAGSEVCFISFKGDVFPCGYLPLKAGNIKEESFKEIWSNSPVFQTLRDTNNLKGKCSICEYVNVCSGCRARAYGQGGDYLAEEPCCVYEPVPPHRKWQNSVP